MKKFTKVFCLALVFVMMTGVFGAFSLTGHNVIHADAASGYQVVELPAIGNAASTKRVECAGTYFWVEALKNSANVRYYAVCAAASADAKGVRLFSSWKSDFTDRYPVFTNGTAVIYATPAKDGASVTVSRISVRGNKKSNLRKITADSFRLLSVYGGKVYFEGAKKDAEPNLYAFTIASPKKLTVIHKDFTATAKRGGRYLTGTTLLELTIRYDAKNAVMKGVPDDDTVRDGKEYTQDELKYYFRDCAFVGDSRTQGIQLNDGITTADFYADRGLNIRTIYTKEFVKAKDEEGEEILITALDALKNKKYRKVFISFGINELGWQSTSIFQEEYGELIRNIKKAQPDSQIIVIGIYPVTEERDSEDPVFNMKRLRAFNKLIKEMAENEGVTYVDVAPAVQNWKGFMTDDASNDGIHPSKWYYKRVAYYLMEMGY